MQLAGSKVLTNEKVLYLTLLKTFEKASGQQLNVDKSSVFFSRNTPNSLKAELCQQLRFNEATDRRLGQKVVVERRQGDFIEDSGSNPS
ncbi:hypothetical protein AgCh_022031 [Apium graveolens]